MKVRRKLRPVTKQRTRKRRAHRRAKPIYPTFQEIRLERVEKERGDAWRALDKVSDDRDSIAKKYLACAVKLERTEHERDGLIEAARALRNLADAMARSLELANLEISRLRENDARYQKLWTSCGRER